MGFGEPKRAGRKGFDARGPNGAVDRHDDDLRTLLEDLDETLDDLRGELEADESPDRRPPTVGELVRFTEEHTIPTVIAVLEASVEALELLQGLLGLARPDGRTDRALDGVGDRALDGVERTFAELRRALQEADLPADPEAQDVAGDARTLAEAVERRIEESRATDDPGTESSRGVEIDVDDGAEESEIERELRSIRDELDDQDGT